MKNKICISGFLAAALIITPNAAFGQNSGANRSMKPTVIITSSDNSVNQTDSRNTRQSQNRIRSGSLCSSSGQFASDNRASNRGALVSSSYNRVNQHPEETVQNRVNEVLRSFCN